VNRVATLQVRQDAYFRLTTTCPGEANRGRDADFNVSDVGNVFFIESANRVEITDCDVWGTASFAMIYDSKNIVIARNRIRYGSFGLRLGHCVRALVEDNDIAGGSWVAGGAIFLSMYGVVILSAASALSIASRYGGGARVLLISERTTRIPAHVLEVVACL
jgi:hypothetical protein